jgi:hypothetical protein
MATEQTPLPPLEPGFPLGLDKITDGIYIIGWSLVGDLKDPETQLEKLMHMNLTPAVEVASYPEIIIQQEGVKTPVLLKSVITGIQPDGQYVSIDSMPERWFQDTAILITPAAVDHRE